MQIVTRIAVYAFAAWTLFHLSVIVDEHTVRCDDCSARPWSEGWVVALRLGAWVAAVVALGRADARRTRTWLALAAAALLALAAAMLFLPTRPFPDDGF